MPKLSEIRVSGFGGQGVILAAIVIGKAAAVNEGNFATMTQAFGPEARGGACSAQVVLSDQPVLYPYVTKADVLVVMSKEAYTKFAPEVKMGGMLLADPDLVPLSDELNAGRKVYTCPATALAEELGKRMIMNIVMVGFFAAITKLVSREALRKAVAESVPEHFRDLNLKAFDKGYDHGIKQLEGAETAAAKA